MQTPSLMYNYVCPNKINKFYFLLGDIAVSINFEKTSR